MQFTYNIRGGGGSSPLKVRNNDKERYFTEKDWKLESEHLEKKKSGDQLHIVSFKVEGGTCTFGWFLASSGLV